MVIDKENRIVSINAVPVDLTSKEFDLLYFLASNKGRVFTKKQIYTHVWAEEYAFDDNNIMSFISKLRKKIEPDPEHPFYILTVRGVGYHCCCTVYEKKLLAGIGIYRTLFHCRTVCGYVKQIAIFIPYRRHIQSFRLSYNNHWEKNSEHSCVAAMRLSFCITLERAES